MQKILIVDDDLWMTKVLNKIINNIGYTNVFVVHNGFDAVAKALAEKPDIIFLDLIMPELDGLTTLKLLKTIPDTQHSKIIICSGNNDIENFTEAIKLGAVDFISKPFAAETIKEKLDLILINTGENNA
jgi:two-component system chemotaxis response regulator CheY